jgi:hypothetical protein
MDTPSKTVPSANASKARGRALAFKIDKENSKLGYAVRTNDSPGQKLGKMGARKGFVLTEHYTG